MQAFLKQHWFLTTLALLIISGISIGFAGYGPQVQPIIGRINPRWTTAGVLFLMAFSLDSDHLWAAFRAPRPVIIGSLINYGLIPALAWLISPLQHPADFRLGLMIAATVPCTTAAASVMTRKARGNDAISLLTTVATNLSCFVMTPLWLKWTTGTQVDLDTKKLMIDLLVAVLVPTILGQILRQPAPLHAFAVKHKAGISIIAQVLIELLVLTAALTAGTKMHEIRAGSHEPAVETMQQADDNAEVRPRGVPEHGLTLARGIAVWGSCFGLHVVALAAGWWLSRATGSSRKDAAAVAFAGSQKTLPIGIYVSSLFGAAYPFALFPMLLYHTTQLFFDTWLASRLATQSDAE
jgi:sodium/bile acid cotransporter 7